MAKPTKKPNKVVKSGAKKPQPKPQAKAAPKKAAAKPVVKAPVKPAPKKAVSKPAPKAPVKAVAKAPVKPAGKAPAKPSLKVEKAVPPVVKKVAQKEAVKVTPAAKVEPVKKEIPAAKEAKVSSKDKKAKKTKEKDEFDLEDDFLTDDIGGDSELAGLEAELEEIEEEIEIVITKDDELEDEDILVEEKDEEIYLTDAEGRRYCRVRDCDQLAAVDAYCRYHYLLFWKRIQVRKKILDDGKLERYVEELTSRYPDKFLEMIRRDLKTEKDFLGAIQELEIDDSGMDNDLEDETQSFIDEVRGMSNEGVGSGDEDEF